MAETPPAAFNSPVKPVRAGNLPLGIQNRARNKDGSVSTVRTISIGVDGGEVLIPTVIGGRVVSDDQAIRHYERTGENFGTFASPRDATAYAKALHNYHARLLRPEKGAPNGAFRGVEGETITSGYRTPEHNKRVRGVANSYHMRKDAQGRPLGRDSTPPPGMSMAIYAAELRRLNPGRDVINEGDHVHMEPR